jgi:branched-chain amino acid transport system permease protein
VTPFIVTGLVLGSIYAISTLGLLLTEVSSGVFNFAHGGIAVFIAWTFYDLNTVHHMSVAKAAFISIGVVSPLIGLFLWAVLFRTLAGRPLYVQLVATIGLFVAIPGIIDQLFGHPALFVIPGLGGLSPSIHKIFGVAVNDNQLIVILATLVTGLITFVVLRFTMIGLKQRAVVDRTEVAELTGINATAVSAAGWAVGTLLAGFAGVLVMPFVGLDPAAFTQLIIVSFAAVVLAKFRSLPWGFAAAIAIGLIQGILTKYISTTSPFAVGVQASVPFFIMLIGVQVHGRTRVGPSSGEDLKLAPRQHRSRGLVIGALLVTAAVLLILPTRIAPIWVGAMGGGVAIAVVLLSNVIVVGEGGMISLCQITFAGSGAIVATQLNAVEHWPLLPSVLVAAVVSALAALAVSGFLLRLSGLYLALATLGFALVLDKTLFQIGRVYKIGEGVPIRRPAIGSLHFKSDLPFYYLALAVFVILGLCVVWLQRSSLGSAMTAARNSVVGAAAVGIRPFRLRVLLFVAGAFVASIGGALFAVYRGRAQPDDFAALIGLVWLAVVVTWGARSVTGALLAGISVLVFPLVFTTYIWPGHAAIPQVLFGLGAIGLARHPGGIIEQFGGPLQRLIDFLGARRGKASGEGTEATVASGPTDRSREHVVVGNAAS